MMSLTVFVWLLDRMCSWIWMRNVHSFSSRMLNTLDSLSLTLIGLINILAVLLWLLSSVCLPLLPVPGVFVTFVWVYKVQALGCREDMPLTIKVQGQDVTVVKEFVYLGSLIHSSTGSTCDISRRSVQHVHLTNIPVWFWLLGDV